MLLLYEREKQLKSSVYGVPNHPARFCNFESSKRQNFEMLSPHTLFGDIVLEPLQRKYEELWRGRFGYEGYLKRQGCFVMFIVLL